MPFIFRPGGVSDPANGIYTVWAGLITALTAAPVGPKTIEFDDSISSPIVIPLNAYNMQDITWARAATANSPAMVNIREGNTFTNLRSFTGNLRVTFTGTTPPVTDLTAGTVVSFLEGAQLRCTAGPFFRNTTVGGRPVMFNLLKGSWLNAGAAVYDAATSGTFALLAADAYDFTLEAGTLSGIDGSFIGLMGFVVGLGISSLGVGQISEVHPNFDGMFLPINTARARLRVPVAVTVSTALTAANQLVRADPTAGPLTITLPSPRGLRGVSLIVKNASASLNAITIAPAAGDTIDGGGNVTITTARGSRKFVSSGGTEWIEV